jgi:hypothetical protein
MDLSTLGGGDAQPIDSLKAFSRPEIKFSDKSGQVWLKSGSVETDVASYPDAYSYVLGVHTGLVFNTVGANTKPKGITWDDTHFWVLGGDYPDQRVYQYTNAGAYTGFNFAVQNLSAATALVWDGTNLVIIQSNYVAVFNTLGVLQTTYNNISSASSITWDGTHYWIMTANSVIIQYGIGFVDTGVSFQLAGFLSTPRSLLWTGNHFWAGTNTALTEHNPDGTPTGSLVTTSLQGTNNSGLCWDGTKAITLQSASGVVSGYDVTSARYVGNPNASKLSGTTFPLFLRIK